MVVCVEVTAQPISPALNAYLTKLANRVIATDAAVAALTARITTLEAEKVALQGALVRQKTYNDNLSLYMAEFTCNFNGTVYSLDPRYAKPIVYQPDATRTNCAGTGPVVRLPEVPSYP